MKKITTFFFLLLISLSIYQSRTKEKESLIPEEKKAQINNYYIYGTRLNIEGNINNINSKFIRGDLILYNNKKTLIYKLNYTKRINNIIFNISNEINKGIYLDNIPKGTYTTYIRLTYNNPKEKYYPLTNNTNYQKTKYYTLSKINNQITINTNNDNFIFKVQKNKKKAYDIVIDPSRGGIDKGTTGNGYNESDITMTFATKIKEKLEWLIYEQIQNFAYTQLEGYIDIAFEEELYEKGISFEYVKNMGEFTVYVVDEELKDEWGFYADICQLYHCHSEDLLYVYRYLDRVIDQIGERLYKYYEYKKGK